MDVNNSTYFLLRGEDDFAHDSPDFHWNPGRGAFTLSQRQQLRMADPSPADALAAWGSSSPLLLDAHGQLARIAADGSDIEYNAGRGFRPLQDGELRRLTAPVGRFLDLSLGGDGRMAAAYSDAADQHGVLVFHLRRRWQTRASLNQAPVRLTVDGANRIWCLTDTRLVLLEGEPLPHPYRPQSDRFEPLSLNPRPLAVSRSQPLGGGMQPLAICVDSERVHVLVRRNDNRQFILSRSLDGAADEALRRHRLASDLPFVVDIAVLSPGLLAAMVPRQNDDPGFRQRDCPVMRLDWREDTGTGTAVLVRERHPMHSLAVPRFVGSLDGRVRYQSEPDPERPDDVPRPRRLKALPRPAYPTSAQVVLRLGNGGQGLDSGRPDTVWHRLYLEGCIPPGCHLRVDARAFNDPAEASERPFVPQPPLLWNPLCSELPFQSGLLPSRPRESGLFETLLQTDSGTIRRLSGRYLQLRLRVDSEGFRTPAIHAIRVYHPRFSYQEAYLPEHFRQGSVDTDPIPGDDDAASGADVRERLLALFEGVLTPIEGRIAAAETLLHPDAAPEEQLDVLARSLGLELPAYWPEQRRRRFLREGCFLQQWRGTLRGICLALDIVTDGAVRRGQIVPVENFRLRRTMATILGVDMDDRDHPLTLGTGMSGNSIVGDSLILSEEDARSFLALFAPELANARESSEVQAFFDRYSHQVTVLLHGQARYHRKVVLAALEAQMPAHVQWRLIETDQPFVLGLAPLLGVDTYVETAPASRPVILDDTYLGREGLLSNPTAFSPRAVNARAAGT